MLEKIECSPLEMILNSINACEREEIGLRSVTSTERSLRPIIRVEVVRESVCLLVLIFDGLLEVL